MKKILVIGDIILDQYKIGTARRISPEAPVPVVDIKQTEFKLGGAANVAFNLDRLRINVTLFGIIGVDNEGDIVRSLVDATKITLLPVSDGRPTTLKERIIAMNQHVCRVDRETKDPYVGQMPDLNGYDAIFVSDYGKGLITPEVIAAVSQTSVLTIADPKPRVDRFKGFTILTPCKSEFEQFSLNYSKQTASGLGVKHLIVTLGAEGVFYATVGGEQGYYDAHRIELIDVTGAGDTFASVLMYCMLSELSFEQAVWVANAAAGESVKHLGCWAPTLAQVKKYITECP